MMNYNSEVTHIVYVFDDKFAEILGVSLASLYKNNKEMANIVVYVLDSGISFDNKQKFLSVCHDYERCEKTFLYIN